MSESKKRRVDWIDDAKGVGIFLVVLAHALRGLITPGILEDGPAFRAVDSWIYSFHMPLFFFLSGLFAGRQVGRGVGVFLRDKFATLVYPYLVWSTLQTLILSAFSRHSSRTLGPADLASILAYPIMQFWFLYALFLIGVAYYVLRRVGLGPSWTFLAFAGFAATQEWVPMGGWWPLYALRIYGIYYAMGSEFDRLGWTGRVERASSAVLALVAAAGYGVVVVVPPQALGERILSSLPVSLCGIAATVALATLLGRVRGLGFVRVLGRYSLEIYVAHTIASAGIRIALLKGLHVRDPATHIVLGTLGGIALPMALAWACRRLGVGYVFQFKKSTRPEPIGGPTPPGG